MFEEEAKVINYVAGAKVEEFSSFSEALYNLEPGISYEIKIRTVSSCHEYAFLATSDEYITAVQKWHPEIIRHDVEAISTEEVKYWKGYVYTLDNINTHRRGANVFVKRLVGNNFIFYAEKTINFGYTCRSSVCRFGEIENWRKPTIYPHPVTYYNFSDLMEDIVFLDGDEMAILEDDGNIIFCEKDTAYLKETGILATETNFTDLLKTIQTMKQAYVGCLNGRLYFC